VTETWGGEPDVNHVEPPICESGSPISRCQNRPTTSTNNRLSRSKLPIATTGRFEVRKLVLIGPDISNRWIRCGVNRGIKFVIERVIAEVERAAVIADPIGRP